MKIAILSGKGGTGKTTIAASLARVTPGCQYVDCDVEEPNGRLFLKPQGLQQRPVRVPVPQVDQAACTGCGACAAICQFHALAVVKGKVLLFPELCHHCGACRLVCQPAAITEVDRTIGTLGSTPDLGFLEGTLNIGEPSGVPIIAALMKRVSADRVAFLDCPPGAGCAVVEVLSGCHYALLVTEPTPFGLHDLAVAVELVSRLGLPAGVVINKADDDVTDVLAFCQDHGLPVLLTVPFSRDLAVAYAQGQLPVDADPHWHQAFQALSRQLVLEAGLEQTGVVAP